LVLQASLGDRVAFDPFPLHDDGLAPPEVDIGRRQVPDALVVALGYLTPVEYAARGGALRSSDGFAPRPVAAATETMLSIQVLTL
jgi:hypothetical protein